MSEFAPVRGFALRESLKDSCTAPKVRGEIPDRNLRDDFAMSALDHATTVYSKMAVAELDRLMGRKNYSKDEAVARLAYNMADAMLAAREI